jgi:hypothetical protein
MNGWKARLDRSEVTRGCRRAAAGAGPNAGGDPETALSTTTLYQQQPCSHLKSFNLYLYPVAMLAARRCQSLSFEVALPLSAVGPYFRILHLCRLCGIAAASLRLLYPCFIVQNVANVATGLTV